MTQVPNWLAALGILVPVATALGGYSLAGRNEEARDRRAADREKRARRESFGERQVERRHEFQRELLLDLQKVLQKEVRAVSRVMLQDQKTLREKGKLFQLPSGMSDEAYDAGLEMWLLHVRVLNDEVREELEKFHEHASGTEVSFAQVVDLPADEAATRLRAAFTELTDHYQAVNTMLGGQLRAELEWVPDWTDPSL